jgi:hypothetical protein
MGKKRKNIRSSGSDCSSIMSSNSNKIEEVICGSRQG